MLHRFNIFTREISAMWLFWYIDVVMHNPLILFASHHNSSIHFTWCSSSSLTLSPAIPFLFAFIIFIFLFVLSQRLLKLFFVTFYSIFMILSYFDHFVHVCVCFSSISVSRAHCSDIHTPTHMQMERGRERERNTHTHHLPVQYCLK